MTIPVERWVKAPVEAIAEMSEGVIGAARVGAELYTHRREIDYNGVLALMIADDMGIRGSQLWVAYKDHCHENLSELCERLIKRDVALKEPRKYEE